MKKHRNRFWAVGGALMGIMLMAAGCSSGNSSKIIRVGVRDSVPGFGYRNPVSETYSGLEVELSQMLAQALGYGEAQLVPVTAENREEAVESGQVDFAVATWTITEERKERFDFSSPYYTDHLGVMAETSTLFQSLADLKGRCIGVSQGSTAALYLAREMAEEGLIPQFSEEDFQAETFRGGITFRCLPTYPELDQALEEGTVDAICSDTSILTGYLDESRILLPEQFARQQFGVCTKKGSQLSGRIEAQIEAWTADGTLDQLIARWD